MEKSLEESLITVNNNKNVASKRPLAKIGISSYNKNGKKATINRPADHRLSWVAQTLVIRIFLCRG